MVLEEGYSKVVGLARCCHGWGHMGLETIAPSMQTLRLQQAAHRLVKSCCRLKTKERYRKMGRVEEKALARTAGMLLQAGYNMFMLESECNSGRN